MARSKPTARRPKPPQRVDLGLDDMFPSHFIEYLNHLPSVDTSAPSETASSADDRPTKRRRLDPSEPSSIHVANGELSFSRPCVDLLSGEYTATRYDVGQFLSFSFKHGRLLITSRSGNPLGSLYAVISLSAKDLSPLTKAILGVAGKNWKINTPGALWTTVTLTLQRRARIASLTFVFELHWNEMLSPYHAFRPNKDRPTTQELINVAFPQPGSADLSDVPDSSAWSPMDFYDAAFVPPKDDISSSIEVEGLEATLFPYQKRTVQWLLNREGVRWTGVEGIPLAIHEGDSSFDTFRPVTDVSGKEFFISDVFHAVTRDLTPFRTPHTAVKGGILAEEMGLGKTLEILGLIILHPRPSPPVMSSYELQAKLVPTGATLIVTPESLRTQWMSEISRHAPGLSVKCYQGCKGLSSVDEEEELVKELAGYDVVITTYAVLSAELHFTTQPPERSRRRERAYRRAKSPLVQLSWWRVCLDEAQMIENGFSQAATVARVIPRINAWGITGTPVKDDVKDLFGLLLFLRYEPYCSATQVWQALIRNHKPLFQKLFNSISLRHTKAMVRDELALPRQRRYVISMPFTAVEEQHYQTLYNTMAEECQLTTEGAPSVDDWDPEDYEEVMRMWLNRLRQTALHPEIASNRRALGHNKARPMRTVDEVLDAMLEQSENTIRADERAYLSSKLTRGQMYENSPRVREALEIWSDVRKEAQRLVSDARKALEAMQGEQTGNATSKPSSSKQPNDSDASDDDADEGSHKGRLGECRRRLRGALEMQHKAVFFCANAYFQIRDQPEMTEPESDEFHRLKKLEDEGYEEAKLIRREILQESHRKATRLITRIGKKASEQTFVEIPELTVGPERGIESGNIADELETLYGELNDQANIIDEWREHVVGLLLKPLLDEDDGIETTGEELNDAAKIQDELMVYVQALRAVIADRQDAISGQTNELIKHETKTSIRVARDGDGPAPEKLLELLAIRAQIKPRPNNCSMRGALSNLRTLISKLSRDDLTASTREVMEGRIADKYLKETHALINAQNKAALGLETEIESFKTAMNLRLEYYRQLQVVSDSVLPYDEPFTELTIERLRNTEEQMRKKVSTAEAKHRYLLHLKEAGSKSNEPRMCVICQTPFAVGVLTVCGHQFCKECMMMWFRAHHNCPVCKKALKADNLHDITINPQQLKVHAEGGSQNQDDAEGQSPERRKSSPQKTMIYSEFNADTLAEIQNIELDGPSYTTKVDTLVKHLLWLRESDPGAKSIVFSQYKGFLSILRNAFLEFRIGYASIDDRGGITKFKEDPSVECFLLHARAHSSGLNLVNASHVFLCEPLLNTALELQAIARVDRIGQQHETTVWLYTVAGTVEESIYNLSVQRRMEHMGRSAKGKSKDSTPELLDASIDAANTLEMEQAALSKLMSKDKTAGENVDKSDLWDCLFGHVARREAEPERGNRVQEQAVIGYLAGEAAEERRQREGETA